MIYPEVILLTAVNPDLSGGGGAALGKGASVTQPPVCQQWNCLSKQGNLYVSDRLLMRVASKPQTFVF